MNGIASTVTPKKNLRKKTDWKRHQKRKRPRYEPQLLDEEPWTRPNLGYVVIRHENLYGEVFPVAEDDIIAVDENVSKGGEARTGHVSVIQIKPSDYLKLSESGLTASSAVLKQYQKALEDVRSHIAASMPVLKIPRITQVPVVRLPKVHLSVPDFSSWVKFDAGVLQRLLRDTLANSLAEVEGSLAVSVDSNWLDDPALILDRLEFGELSESAKRMAFAHAESLAFSDSQKQRLLTVYDASIEESRFTEDDEEITAICSAIRKYAMNMGSDRLSRYASWFAPSVSERTHPDVELELTKGAYWHLRYLETDASAELKSLQDVLADEACDYLRPRLMLDKNYASIAKFAIAACLLIDARTGGTKVSHRVWERKTRLSMDWFDRLVKFEIGKAIQSIEKRDEHFARQVKELLEALDCEGE